MREEDRKMFRQRVFELHATACLCFLKLQTP